MPKKPLFVFFGNNSFLNRGCEAIVRTTIEILQNEFGDSRFVNALLYPTEMEVSNSADTDLVHLVPEKNPKKPKWDLAWFEYQYRKKILRRPKQIFEPWLRKAAAALALGGDNYSLDYGDPRVYFQANEAVVRKKKPLVLWGATIGPFSADHEMEKYAAEELKKVSLICARESETVHYLAGLGITDNVRQVADPAFILKPSSIECPPPELDVIRRPCIGLNFSPLMAHYWNQEETWADMAADCLREMLRQFDMPLVLIPHVIWPENDDCLFMTQLARRLNVPQDRLLVIDRSYNARQLKWIISHMRIFIGCRTHATIAALSSGVPTLSIGYSMKAKGINMDLFGHDNWLLSLKELSPEYLTDRARVIIEAQAEVRDILRRKMPSYAAQAFKAGHYLKEILS